MIRLPLYPDIFPVRNFVSSPDGLSHAKLHNTSTMYQYPNLNPLYLYNIPCHPIPQILNTD
jgi:hypothetical protein